MSTTLNIQLNQRQIGKLSMLSQHASKLYSIESCYGYRWMLSVLTYVSLFLFWVYSLLIFISDSIIRKIVSLRCDLHFLRSTSGQHTTRPTKWLDRRRTDLTSIWTVSWILEAMVTDMSVRGRIIITSSSLSKEDWKLKRVAEWHYWRLR